MFRRRRLRDIGGKETKIEKRATPRSILLHFRLIITGYLHILIMYETAKRTNNRNSVSLRSENVRHFL